MKTAKTCKTCKWSRWHLTATGRIVKQSSGKCVVEVPVPVLPLSVTQDWGFTPVFHRSKVGKEWSDCPLWEENTGKPIAEGTP